MRPSGAAAAPLQPRFSVQHIVLTVFKGGSFVSLESRSILLSEDRKVVMNPFFSSDCGPCLSVASLCKNKYMDRNFRAAASFMRY